MFVPIGSGTLAGFHMAMGLMQKPLVEQPPGRDPANELYDRACELLLAAQGIRSAAGVRGSTPAFAAAVGCIDASLAALADGASAMRREATHVVTRARESDQYTQQISAADAAREFSSLAEALTGAHQAAGRMRERIGPLLAGLTLSQRSRSTPYRRHAGTKATSSVDEQANRRTARHSGDSGGARSAQG